MSDNKDNHNDIDRYLNDREFRRKKLSEKKSAGNKGPKIVSGLNGGNDLPDLPYFKWFMRIGGVLLLFTVAFIFYLSLGMPSIDELENPKTDVASFVMSRDGEVLDKYFTENRTYVSYENISTHVVDALIAVEDHRFYQHWGIDVIRTAAIPYHLLRGNMQGGSTITQQLARNLYRKIGRQVTVTRKDAYSNSN